MGVQVVQDAFRENMGAQDKKTEKYLAVIREKERITPGNLAKMFGVSGSAISSWVGKRIRDGMVEWVDKDGYHFVDDKALETAKRKGTAFIKISDTYRNEIVGGLPTPFDLSGDPRWNEGGELLKLYDLGLEKQTAVCPAAGPEKVFTGVNPVFTPPQNTVGEDEIVNIIQYFGEEPDVLSEMTGQRENNFEKPQEIPALDPGNGH